MKLQDAPFDRTLVMRDRVEHDVRLVFYRRRLGNPIWPTNVPVYRMGFIQITPDGEIKAVSGSIGPWYPSEALGLTPVELEVGESE